MKRLLIIILALAGALTTLGQGLETESPLWLTSRQEAMTYERFDHNLERCAMVVVHIDNDNVNFEGDVMTSQLRPNGEWWVWMTKGASWLSVTIPHYTPLRMEFNTPLQSGKTYEVRIRPAKPKQLLVIAETFNADLTRTDATKYSRKDAQGRTCALLRMGMVLTDVQFTGAVDSKYLNSEWWVWLSPGTTSLTIRARGYQPLTVQFEPVQSSVTYLMTVHKAGETAPPGQPEGGRSGVDEMEDWVDLGLPSGLLWATCNLGATKPEKYGDYYAWGETQPKTTYGWDTYKYCKGSRQSLAKYCSISSYGYNGFTDNLTTLQPVDDAATTKLGNGARMPTKADWQELIDNTTSEWTTMNGVEGRKFTAANGKSLFLPAAGSRWDGSLDDAGSYGLYWSSSLSADYPSYAWGCYFRSGGVGMYDDDRYSGRTVRAVRQR